MSVELLYAVEQADKIMENEVGEAKGVNSFALVLEDKDGGELFMDTTINGPCYALLGFDTVESKAHYLINYFMTGSHKWRDAKAVQKPFIEYMLQRSPYKDAFLIKDVDYVLKHGLLCRVDVPSNLLVGGLTVIRSLWEYTYIPLRWKELVDLGVQEDIALIAAHCIDKAGKQYTYTQQGFSHRAFNPNYLSAGSVRNFLKHDMVRPEKNFSESGNFLGITRAYQDEKGDKFFRGYTPDGGKDVKNGWGEVVRNAHDTSLEPFAKWLIEQYAILLEKPKPKKKPKKKAPKKAVDIEAANKKAEKGKEHPLIGLITQANGFTLAEVREIRKNLREIIAGGARLGFNNRRPDLLSINKNIEWMKTPQGHAYWCRINNILAENNVGDHYEF